MGLSGQGSSLLGGQSSTNERTDMTRHRVMATDAAGVCGLGMRGGPRWSVGQVASQRAVFSERERNACPPKCGWAGLSSCIRMGGGGKRPAGLPADERSFVRSRSVPPLRSVVSQSECVSFGTREMKNVSYFGIGFLGVGS